MKEFRKELKKLADELDFTLHGAKGRRIHFLLVSNQTGRKVFVSATPRNAWRTLKNVRAQLRRCRNATS